MRKPRVLIFVSGLAIGDALGGAERFGLGIAQSLDQEHFEPIVCAFWHHNTPGEQHWAARLQSSNIETFFAVERGQGFSPARYAQALHNIVDQTADRPIDIIHSHFQLGSVTALLLKRRLQTKAVIRTAHGTVRREWRNTWLGSICRRIFTRTIFPLLFDVEVGVSQAVVASLDQRPIARLTGKQALLIHNAIHAQQFQQRGIGSVLRTELGIPSSDIVIGSVGRLSEQKGYRYLIEAAPTILEALPNARFVIVGHGELAGTLHRQVTSLGMDRVFIFTGPRQDIAAIYDLMDVFVLPSLWEGLPTVVLESMASSVPVIATDIPGTRELVIDGQSGWLAKPRDPEHLAQVIIEVLNHPDQRRSVAQYALEEVMSLYSARAIAEQYQELYSSFLTDLEPNSPHLAVT